jgi:CheY-specific phosphatase CheX
MPPNSQAEEIARKFGLESLPESVQRLTQMIAKRDGNAEDFIKLVEQDAQLSARVIRAANPRAKSEEDYTFTTVEEALHRTGMSCALLLAMSEPLVRAVFKTFKLMLDIDLKALAPKDVDPFTDEHVVGEVSFTGKANGFVDLRLPNRAVPLIGERLLGLGPEDLRDYSVANDVVGELCNMIVGNFKSNLCDAGLNCKLSAPKIVRTTQFKLRVVDGGTSERQGFRSPELDFFADLSVNPWDD